MQTVAFEDLAKNTFQVTITRVQQEALKHAGSRVPTPSEQLALVAARRKKKHETSQLHLDLLHVISFFTGSFQAFLAYRSKET